MAPTHQIVVSGAREHNLKDVTVALPRDALVVITGLSGSGKSSLAFDTIYAEGQRRYVESLSAYARQFLGQMDKPDVDSIEGLSPAISIDQKTTSRNPRSTVGTVTEIYDYLRLLWSRIGQPHCYNCGKPIAGQSAEQIIDQVLELPEGTRFMVLAPVVRGRKGEYGKLFDELRAEGFSRVEVDGELRLLEEPIDARQEVQARHLAWSSTGWSCATTSASGSPTRSRPRSRWRTAWSRSRPFRAKARPRSAGCTPRSSPASTTAPSMPELEPRIFSFNSPHGACERCTGLGSQMEIDPELVVPDPTLTIGEGAIAPWAMSSSNYYEQLVQAMADEYGIDLECPWEKLSPDEQELFLSGTNGKRIHISYRNRYGRKRSYATRFEGVVEGLQRRYKETDSENVRERIEEFMSLRAVPGVRGLAAAARVARGAARRHGDPRVHGDVRAAGERVGGGARAVRDRPPHRPADPARDHRASAVPRQRGHRLPVDGPRGGHALGRRGAADPAGDPDRFGARRGALRARRAVDRPASARQLEADRHARAPARPRQHGAGGRARRADDARGRPHRRPRAGRRRARRPGRRRGHRRGRRAPSRDR